MDEKESIDFNNFDLTPSTPRSKGSPKQPRMFTSTPKAEKEGIRSPKRQISVITIDDEDPVPPKKAIYVQRLFYGDRTPTSDRCLLKQDRKRFLRDVRQAYRKVTYRLEKMIDQELNSDTVKESPKTRFRRPRAQDMPDMTPVRRSPRLQKARELNSASAKLCLIDENNNNEKVDVETNTSTLNHSSSHSSTSKLVLDTSTEIRNWCRAHSNVDRIAPFLAFVVFAGLLYYVATVLHTAQVPQNTWKFCQDNVRSAVAQIQNLFK